MILCANLHQSKGFDFQNQENRILRLNVKKNLLVKILLFLELKIKLIFQSLKKNNIKGCFFIGNFKCISGMQKMTLIF